MRLSAVRIFVNELEPARRFYQEVLALPLRFSDADAGYCTFMSEGINVVVECLPPDASADDQLLVSRFTGLSFETEDIVADCARLEDAGVNVIGAPERQGWGGWLATFQDPSGNALQLVQYPS